MPYKFKSLMVNVMGEGYTGGEFAARTCDATGNGPTCMLTNNGDGYFLGLQLGTVLTLGLHTHGTPGGPPTSLAALKAQLQQQLEAVEQQQAAAEEGMRPQSVDEVDQLSSKLTGALNELKLRRAELIKQRVTPAKKTAAKKTVAKKTAAKKTASPRYEE